MIFIVDDFGVTSSKVEKVSRVELVVSDDFLGEERKVGGGLIFVVGCC